jgi:aspartate racemase
MKTLGLLGGMSWESSIEYERLINRAVRDKLGGTSSADLVIRSFNFAEIAALQKAGEWDAMGDLLAAAANDLYQAGADAILICTNTMHLLADRVQRDLSVPLIHIVDATGSEIAKRGVTKVLLLGTLDTMQQDFFKNRLAENFGIETVVPDAAAMQEVQRIIYEELVQGVFNESSKTFLLELINEFAAAGVGGVIAGCTEIELLIKADDVPLEYFETLRIHAAAAVEFALSE